MRHSSAQRNESLKLAIPAVAELPLLISNYNSWPTATRFRPYSRLDYTIPNNTKDALS